jgi:hypothetical protein
MILHLLLWTLRLAEIHNEPLHEDVRTRTQSAFNFMQHWVDPVSGFVPNYGSDDGSLVFPLAHAEYRDYRPLLQLGTAVLHRPALQPGPWYEVPLWFGVKPALAEQTPSAPLPSIDPRSSALTGYFRLGDEKSWAMIRAARYTRRPFQADQLHVDLWWQGINLARDAGTYLYNGPVPWNNGFAATAVHNTVTVDHRDQMRRAGRFLWLDWAQASGRLSRSSNSACADRFEGEHDGYSKLGVTHRRIVQWLGKAGWVIVDDIEGTGEHSARLHWLAADLPYEPSDSPFEVVFKKEHTQIRWSIFSSVQGGAAIVRAGTLATSMPANEFSGAETQLLGWQSLTYGDLRPAVSLIYETRSPLPVRFVTVILTEERFAIESSAGQIVIINRESRKSRMDDSEIYRVSLAKQ